MQKQVALIAVAILSLVALVGCKNSQQRELLNVSYDPTRELYEAYNKAFAKHWLELTGETIAVEKSNGGSGSQARAVVSGLEADVVTLALASDVDIVANAGLFADGADNPESPDYWQKRLPNNSCPYASTIVILVRKGNPKNIKGWDDLARADVAVVTPNPKTSGGARWNYLAVWGYALDKALADHGGLNAIKDGNLDTNVLTVAQAQAYDFTEKVFLNAFAQGMQSGARGATDDFVKNNVGDAFLAWENEAILAREYTKNDLEIIVPKMSILAEPPVAIVDKNVDYKKTRDIAEEYLNYLYSPESQELIAQNHYRPSDETVLAKYRDQFPELELFTVDDVFGGWVQAQEEHFGDAGYFNQMLEKFAKKAR
ncbi:MAG: sulfate ABC transporter substrate-binding protein [Planctomycetia bacterium]|nr:sulfate ABC transporter substrate-binding protein [Planctomycetia bacterium]